MPLALHPWCGLTSKGTTFLTKLCKLTIDNGAAAGTRAERLQDFWASFSSTLMRAIATQLRSATLTGSERTLLPQLPVWSTPAGAHQPYQ